MLTLNKDAGYRRAKSIFRDPITGNITAINANPPGRKRANALPPNSVSSETLADQSVQNRHIAAGAVTGDKIAGETIQTNNLTPEIQSLLRQIPRMSSALSSLEPNVLITITHNLGNVVVAIIVGVIDTNAAGSQETYGNHNQTVFATVNNAAPDGTFQLTSSLPTSVNARWWAFALPGYPSFVTLRKVLSFLNSISIVQQAIKGFFLHRNGWGHENCQKSN